MNETGTAPSFDDREGARITRTIRIEIDDRWLLDEMRDLLMCIDNLYNVNLFFKSFESDWLWKNKPEEELSKVDCFYKNNYFERVAFLQRLPRLLDSYYFQETDYSTGPNFSRYLYPDERLEVKKIKYGSLGFWDVLGVAGTVKELRLLVQYIVESVINRKRRKLELDALALENEAKQLRNRENEIQNKNLLVENRMQNLKERTDLEKNRLLAESRKHELEIERIQKENKRLDLELIKTNQEIESKKIENAERVLNLVRDYTKNPEEFNFSDDEQEKVEKWAAAAAGTISDFAKDGKLKSVSLLDE